jgi:hypothetical protein
VLASCFVLAVIQYQKLVPEQVPAVPLLPLPIPVHQQTSLSTGRARGTETFSIVNPGVTEVQGHRPVLRSPFLLDSDN